MSNKIDYHYIRTFVKPNALTKREAYTIAYMVVRRYYNPETDYFGITGLFNDTWLANFYFFHGETIYKAKQSYFNRNMGV